MRQKRRPGRGKVEEISTLSPLNKISSLTRESRNKDTSGRRQQQVGEEGPDLGGSWVLVRNLDLF